MTVNGQFMVDALNRIRFNKEYRHLRKEAKQMQVIEDAKGWYVEVQHGSGDGRSYGGGFAFLAEGETLRGDQTRHYHGPYATEAEAQAKANEDNKYYDGSDYN